MAACGSVRWTCSLSTESMKVVGGGWPAHAPGDNESEFPSWCAHMSREGNYTPGGCARSRWCRGYRTFSWVFTIYTGAQGGRDGSVLGW